MRPEDDAREAATPRQIGRVVSIKGALALVQLVPCEETGLPPAEVGALVRIEGARHLVFGMIATLEAPAPRLTPGEPELWLAELELVGEARRGAGGAPARFHRGVTSYPRLGAPVVTACRDDLACVFHVEDEAAVTVGGVYQDETLPAKVRINELLGKHFAVLGTTGTGKSCTVALLLQSILDRCPHAHVLLLDAHAEYAAAFGDRAEIITHSDLRIPFWALTFEELVEVLIADKDSYRAEIELLADLVRQAKAMFAAPVDPQRPQIYRRRAHDVAAYSEDAPLPYRVSDLLGLIDERMGTLEHQRDIALYRRLRGRIDARIRDERYAFMFGAEAAQTSLRDVFSRLFRLPVDGKPIAILELTGLPSEVLSVMVSVTSRLAFDFGLRSEGKAPVLYVCEEAHKYIPSDASRGFSPARRSIARIAKEGRKYGVALGIITQRPAELDATIFSQCNTLFSMRLTNDRDQEIVRSAASDAAASLIRFLPSLVAGEAIAFGDGVALPLRLRFTPLENDQRPASATANFADGWSEDWADQVFAARIAAACSRNAPVFAEDAQATPAPREEERRIAEPTPDRPVVSAPSPQAPRPNGAGRAATFSRRPGAFAD